MELTLKEKEQKAMELIKTYLESHPDKHSIAFSGGKDSTVLLHLAMRSVGGALREKLRVDAVLSDTEFGETHDFISELSNVFDIRMNRYFYKNDPEKPEEASKQNKTDEFKKVLADVDCWFSGIRRDEAETRLDIKYVEDDNGLLKINPIADFTEKDIWRYLAIYRVPVNKAYKAGYRSLSCRLSSKPEESGDEPERNGRWKGTENECQECGIHSQSLR